MKRSSALKVSLAVILKLCKLTLFPGSDLWILFFWNSPRPAESLKTIKLLTKFFGVHFTTISLSVTTLPVFERNLGYSHKMA